jgi:hypothetical protein
MGDDDPLKLRLAERSREADRAPLGRAGGVRGDTPHAFRVPVRAQPGRWIVADPRVADGHGRFVAETLDELPETYPWGA